MGCEEISFTDTSRKFFQMTVTSVHLLPASVHSSEVFFMKKIDAQYNLFIGESVSELSTAVSLYDAGDPTQIPF